MTSSRRKSRRVFAICGPVKWLNRSLSWEASGDDRRGQLVGMVRRRHWVGLTHSTHDMRTAGYGAKLGTQDAGGSSLAIPERTMMLTCRSRPDPPHTRADAGSPLKRARKQGVRLDDGSIIAFPYLTHPRAHPRAGLSNTQWRELGPAEKIERVLGMPLYRANEILCWGPITEIDLVQVSIKMQVWRVAFMIGVKALLDGSLGREAARDRDRERLIEELARRAGEEGWKLVRGNSGPCGEGRRKIENAPCPMSPRVSVYADHSGARLGDDGRGKVSVRQPFGVVVGDGRAADPR